MPVRVPSVAGSAWNDGTSMIVKFGTKSARSAADGRRNRLRGEDARPRGLGVDAEAALVRGMGADEAVLGVHRAIGEVGHQPRPEAVVVLEGDRAVDVAPPDLPRRRRLLDDELVLRRAAGVLAGANDERTLGGDDALAGPHGVLVQLGRGEIGSDDPADGRVPIGPTRGVGRGGVGGGLGHRLGLLGAQAIALDRPAARSSG